jgi:hypothetical protein
MITLHPYRGTSPPEGNNQDIIPLRRIVRSYTPSSRLFTPPLAYGEWGYQTISTTLSNQANFMTRGWLCSLITGVAYSSWYEWIDYNSASNDTESRFGVVYSNFSTAGGVYSFTGKPAYEAWRVMADLVVNSGYKYNKEVVLAHDNSSIGLQRDYCVLFSGNGGNVFILWTISTDHSAVLYLGNGEFWVTMLRN